MSILDRLQRLPSLIRFALWPVAWRLMIILILLLTGQKVLRVPSIWKFGDLAAMFYSVSAVIGVIAAFLLSCLTIIATNESESSKRIKKQGGVSLFIVVLYAVFSMLVGALAASLIAPASGGHEWPIWILLAIVFVCLIETALVGLLLFIAIVDK